MGYAGFYLIPTLSHNIFYKKPHGPKIIFSESCSRNMSMDVGYTFEHGDKVTANAVRVTSLAE